MIKDEFKRLSELLAQAQDIKSVQLEEILKEAVIFFNDIKEGFLKGTPEEKKEMIRMMTELQSKLQDIYKSVAEKSGMSEEELYVYSENPSNFSPEQWKLMQETKNKLFEATRQLYQKIEGKEKTEALKNKQDKTKTPSKKPPGSKKSGWLKS